MSFRDIASQGAVDSRENNADDSEDDGQSVEDYGIDVDFDEIAFVRCSPTVFVTGVFPNEDEGNPIIRFKNADYNDGRYDQGYLGLVIEDPEPIVSEDEGTGGTVILKTDDQDSTDYRMFDSNDDETKVVEGMGVKFGNKLYEGEVLEEFSEDRILLTVSGASSKNVARRLDKKGALVAGMDEENGGVNDGLIEYKPYDQREDGQNEVTSRYARDPELKTDLHETRVGLFLARREELDDENTGYLGAEGQGQEGDGRIPLLGEAPDGVDTHAAPDEASYAELVADDNRGERPMYWYVVFNVEAEEEIEMEETDDEIVGYSWLDDDWDQFDPSVGGIPDDQWEFVEHFVEMVDEGEVTDTSEENIIANIEDNADAFESEPETDSMVNAITNRVE